MLGSHHYRREVEETLEQDAADHGLRPLAEYLARWPECEDIVRKAHQELSAAAEPRTPKIRTTESGLIDSEILDRSSASRSQASSLAGTQIGPYRIVRLLGRGGFAAVYLCEDMRVREHRVAVKILTRGLFDAGSNRELRQEAEIASRLDDPGLCPVLNFDFDCDTPYLVLRYVEGVPLSQRLAAARKSEDLASFRWRSPTGDTQGPSDDPTKARPKNWEQTVLLIEKVARALHVAHESGIVHRDIKPDNIMVKPSGDPVILDFGIARNVFAATRTIDREIVGTVPYMSPEQLSVEGKFLDRRTDVFSLSVVLFECLTLRRPFDAPNEQALAQAIRQKDHPPIRELDGSLPSDLGIIVDNGLEKDPARRYATALDLAEDLRRLRERKPILARPVTRWIRLTRWAQRNRTVASLLTLVFALLVSGLVAVNHQRLRANENSRALGESNTRLTKQTSVATTMLGELALLRGDWEEARTHLEQAIHLEETPEGKVGLELRLAEVHDNLLESERTNQLLHRATLRGTSPQKAKARMLGHFTDLNRGVKAASILERIRNDVSNKDLSPEDRRYATALLANDAPTALEALESLIKDYPTFRRAYLTIGPILLFLGRFEDARAHAKSLMARYPRLAGGLILEAVCAEALGDKVAAQKARDHLGERFTEGDLKLLNQLQKTSLGVIEVAQNSANKLLASSGFGVKAPSRFRSRAKDVLVIGQLRLLIRGGKERTPALVVHPCIAGILEGLEAVAGITSRLIRTQDAAIHLDEACSRSLAKMPAGFFHLLRGFARFDQGKLEEAIADWHVSLSVSSPAMIARRHIHSMIALALYNLLGMRPPGEDVDRIAIARRFKEPVLGFLSEPNASASEYLSMTGMVVLIGELELGEMLLRHWRLEHPNDPMGQYCDVRLAHDRGDHARCLRLGRQFIDQHPGHGKIANVKKFMESARKTLAEK